MSSTPRIPPVPHEQPDRIDGSGDRTVGDGVRCRWCQYELRGVRLLADCPECGRSVVDTVRPLLERASAQRGIDHPRVVAGTILFGALLVTLAAGGSAWAAIRFVLDDPGRIARDSATAPLAFGPDGMLLLHPPAAASTAGLVAAFLFAGLVSAVYGSEPVLRQRGWRRFAIGSVGLVLAALLLTAGLPVDRDPRLLVCAVLLATAAVLVIHDALAATVARRVPRVRRAGAAWQRLGPMLAGLTILAGLVLARPALADPIDERIELSAMVTAFLCVVGAVYLLANATWIAGALIGAAPSLDSITVARGLDRPPPTPGI